MQPYDTGDRAQLFVDRLLVQSAENVTFTLHPAQKHPLNPLITADQPWETWRVSLVGSVLYDTDEFKMWYTSNDDAEFFPPFAWITAYATSRDGIRWDKPAVGTLASPKTPRHNAVAGHLMPNAIKDPDDPDPARRYKMICWSEKDPRGYHTMISPDGLRWTFLSKTPICRECDVINGYYDRQRKRYVAFAKIGDKVPGLPHSRRIFWLITSEDFEHWTQPELAFYPDPRDDDGSLARIERVRPMLDVPDDPKVMRTEFYGVGVYQHEGCTLAFPWVFTINNNNRFGNQEGPCEIQLAISRDLAHWERPFRAPCIPVGNLGEWDCGFFQTATEALRVRDEIWLYYSGCNFTHGCPAAYDKLARPTKQFTESIGLAIWKLDRFVSVDAGAEGGTLTTIPIVFQNNRLDLNAATKKGGSVTVEILDSKGAVLAHSQLFTGDELRHRVTWTEAVGLAKLAGQPVSLRFHLRNAELYSFAFRLG